MSSQDFQGLIKMPVYRMSAVSLTQVTIPVHRHPHQSGHTGIFLSSDDLTPTFFWQLPHILSPCS